MSKTTHVGNIRSRGGRLRASPGSMVMMLKAWGDPTEVAATPMKTDSGPATLPKGAIHLSTSSLGGANAGTVDIGDGTDDTLFADELPAGVVDIRSSANSAGGPLTADTVLHMKAGATPATSGTTAILVEYVMEDDGKL